MTETQQCDNNRRVIVLEDALLHPQLPVVVWAMMAQSKGYAIGGTLANALLAVVQHVAACAAKDSLPRNTGLWRTPATLSAADAVAGVPLAPAEGALVKALLARAAFGGMREDAEMLQGYAGYWGARFAGLAAPPPAFVPPPVGAAAPAAAGGGGAAAAAAAAAGGAKGEGRAADGGRAGDGGNDGDGGGSAWLRYVECVYGAVATASSAPRVTLVGPLQR